LGGHKRRLGVWGWKSPSGFHGGAPVGGLDDEVPQKLKLFVKLHIIFAIKYNKQLLLLLLDKINPKILGDITMETKILLAVWRSGSVVSRMSEVTLYGILGWMTVFGRVGLYHLSI